MTLTLQDVAWHRSVGHLIESLNQPDFWLALSRLLDDYVPLDSWVVLLFSNDRPHIFACSEYEGDGPDPLVHEYVKGLYLLDPFYIANRETPASGLFRLSEVAPECFTQTDYYKLFFTHNIVADEVQINVQLDDVRTLCLSLGSKKRFSPEQIALLDLIRPWVAGLMRQRMFFDEAMAEKIASSPIPHWQSSLEEALEQLGTPLTARELDVVRLVLSGRSNKEVASKLAISVETVKSHRRNIYGKLDIKSQSELFSMFMKVQTDS